MTVYTARTKTCKKTGRVILSNGRRCKNCAAAFHLIRIQTVPAQFIAGLASNMASHSSVKVAPCKAILKKLMAQPGSNKCLHCGQVLSFVRHSDAKTRFKQASVDKKNKEAYTHPKQKNRLVCLFCQYCFGGDAATRYPDEDRAKFHVEACSHIHKGDFDANASWDQRIAMNKKLHTSENSEPFTEEEMAKYLNSTFMDHRHIIVNKQKVFGNMTKDDYRKLFIEQSFRDMNTGKRLSLNPKSTLYASPDQIKPHGNYDIGNVQFTALPLNLGKIDFCDVEFRDCIQTLYLKGPKVI